MSASSLVAPPAPRVPGNPIVRTSVMLASDLDDALRATLYDLMVDEGYHVCAPRDSAEGLALLRAGECRAILIVSLPPASMPSQSNWLASLTAAQSTESIIALRLRKHCALIGLASGLTTLENRSVSVPPLWNLLVTRWRTALAVPCDLDTLTGALAAASQWLQGGA
jgi:hypothetical protein